MSDVNDETGIEINEELPVQIQNESNENLEETLNTGTQSNEKYNTENLTVDNAENLSADHEENSQEDNEEKFPGDNKENSSIPSRAIKQISVVIVDKYKGINKSQAQQLEMKILDALDKFVIKKPPIFPLFYGTFYGQKKLTIVAANKFSGNWLKKMITYLPPPWEGARLNIMSVPCEPIKIFKPKRYPKIEFFIPDGLKKLEFEQLIKHIEICNPPIKTGRWEKLKEEIVEKLKEETEEILEKQIGIELKKETRETVKGVHYQVCINGVSLSEIKKKNGCLFYRLGTVKIIIPDDQLIDKSIDVKNLY